MTKRTFYTNARSTLIDQMEGVSSGPIFVNVRDWEISQKPIGNQNNQFLGGSQYRRNEEACDQTSKRFGHSERPGMFYESGRM